jgi:hypothetical protein
MLHPESPADLPSIKLETECSCFPSVAHLLRESFFQWSITLKQYITYMIQLEHVAKSSAKMYREPLNYWVF